MTEHRKKILAVALLGFMAILLVVRLSGASRSGNRSPRPGSDTDSASEQMSGASSLTDGQTPGDLARACLDPGTAEIRLPERDLFAPAPRGRAPSAAPRSPEEEERRGYQRKLRALSLQATLQDGDVRLAIINGKPVHEGEEISGFLLERVETDRVELKRGGQTFELSMPGT